MIYIYSLFFSDIHLIYLDTNIFQHNKHIFFTAKLQIDRLSQTLSANNVRRNVHILYIVIFIGYKNIVYTQID